MSTSSFDIAIIGGGILGLAHAWRAAERGLRVVAFERNPQAIGASIRNFGMVWPIGQPFGERFDLAIQSRELWLELARQANFWINPCGSLHLAHRQDEWSVLQEFYRLATSNGIRVTLLNSEETQQATPAANGVGLIGSLRSDFEVAVNPAEVVKTIPSFLQDKFGLKYHFSTPIVEIDGNRIKASDDRQWFAEQIIVCNGDDVISLFPGVFKRPDLKRCKLHMMKTVAQPDGWRINTHLASGLTLRHYSSFTNCASLQRLVDRVQAETPELDRFGIHVMASQNQLGEVILGDSHEYDDAIEPFDRSEIDDLILRELKKQFQLPTWQIASRWHGIYLKSFSSHMFESTPQANVHIISGVGGAGMTLSLGIAEQTCRRILDGVITSS